MLKLKKRLLVSLCDFLSDKEKMTILASNWQMFTESPDILFTQPTNISEMLHLPIAFYNNFTNVIINVDISIFPQNSTHITCRYIFAHAIRYTYNVKFIDHDNDNNEKIVINFIEPVRKTKFDQLNVTRYVTYCGKIDRFDHLNPGISLHTIAEFYVAHDDLDRFRKIPRNDVGIYNHKYLVYAQLMRPVPLKIFSFILNDKRTKAYSAQFIEYLMCMIELGMPFEIRQMIIKIHAEMFWDRIYDKIVDE